jgi:hypothetical protein
MNSQSVRIIVYRGGESFYLAGFAPNPREKNKVLPQLVTPSEVRQSLLLSRDRAISIVRELRSVDWDCRVVRPDGVILFEEEIRFTPAAMPASDERVPMYVGDVLIVPASLGRWAIRFPNSGLESIYADTPDDVYRKLAEHPRFAELVKFAEKYVAPDIQTAIQPAVQQRGRLRPGSL